MAVVTPNTQIVAITASRRAPRPAGGAVDDGVGPMGSGRGSSGSTSVLTTATTAASLSNPVGRSGPIQTWCPPLGKFTDPAEPWSRATRVPMPTVALKAAPQKLTVGLAGPAAGASIGATPATSPATKSPIPSRGPDEHCMALPGLS